MALLLAGGFLIFDNISMSSKIHNGVKVGAVDVSGMTVEEAARAIDDAYLDNFDSTSVYIFADEETANSSDHDLRALEDDALAEQLSFEDALQSKKMWITSASSLEATLPSQALAEEAFKMGRSNLYEKIDVNMNGRYVKPYVEFNDDLLDRLIADIDNSVGDPMNDFNIEIENGEASIVEGNDGNLLDPDEFTETVSEKLLTTQDSAASFIADVKYTHYRVDASGAEKTRDAVNKLIANGASFSTDSTSFTVNAETLGDWTSTEVQNVNGDWRLCPYIDKEKAASSMLSLLGDASASQDISFTFDVSGEEPVVKTDGEVEIPNAFDALEKLDGALYGNYRETGEAELGGSITGIPVEMTLHTGDLTLNEAISSGVVSKFSSYTTKFTSSSGAANRNYNIKLCASLLNNSVVPADGGKWSFNEVVGDTDESKGFKDAGVIQDGELIDGVGGGICQVATTVFNAAYEAGLPIDKRRNHSLYMASYPSGRDAAINYPTIDLVWTNSTPSDILVVASCTDSSITVSLIGQDPKYKVETEVGEWIKGQKFSTKYKQDDNLGANASYIKTAGTDGMEITVVRTVTDEDGNVVSEKSFNSSYAPVNRVIVFGAGSDMDAIRSKYSTD